MKWHTEVPVNYAGFDLNHTHGILALGSCFSQEIGSKLASAKFRININPFGTLYHPAAIARVLEYGLAEKIWTKDNSVVHQDIWYSWHHHGQVSALSETELQSKVEGLHQALKDELHKTDVIMITPGTAWGFMLKENGDLVANCHKIPSHNFEKTLFTVEETVLCLENMIHKVRTYFPHIRFIFTLSPVRHLKDGFHENQLSKATLLLGIEEIIKTYDDVYYFPAYEIMMDELRDYRFYAADKIHPSEEATDYIWKKFEAWCMNETTQDLNRQIHQLTLQLNHRPLNPGAPGHHAFRQKLGELLEQLQLAHPEINWEKEKNMNI